MNSKNKLIILIEPSNTELSELPEASLNYIRGLESEIESLRAQLSTMTTDRDKEASKVDLAARLLVEAQSGEAVAIAKVINKGGSGEFMSIQWRDNVEDGSLLFTAPQAAKVPEVKNITEVKLSGDQSVQVTFASCRSASVFKRFILATKESGE